MNSCLKKLPACCLSTSLFLYFFSCLSMISSTRSIDTYMSLLTCSERMMLPFTGIVTSIFCLSFSTLKVTCTSVSGVKYFSSLPILSSTAVLKPGVTSIFLPIIIYFIWLTLSVLDLCDNYSTFVYIFAIFIQIVCNICTFKKSIPFSTFFVK